MYAVLGRVAIFISCLFGRALEINTRRWKEVNGSELSISPCLLLIEWILMKFEEEGKGGS